MGTLWFEISWYIVQSLINGSLGFRLTEVIIVR